MEPQEINTEHQPETSTTPTPQPPKTNNSLVVIMSVLLMIVVFIAVIFYLQIQKLSKKLTENINSTPQPTQVATQSATLKPTPTYNPNLKKYTNTKYGFEFSYPEKYKVLSDSTNLYGWPKAILLLYKGGQSYDMPVEIWGSEAEYKEKYSGPTYDLTVFKVGAKFITLLNTNKDPEIAEVIKTFKIIEPTTKPNSTPN